MPSASQKLRNKSHKIVGQQNDTTWTFLKPRFASCDMCSIQEEYIAYAMVQIQAAVVSLVTLKNYVYEHQMNLRLIIKTSLTDMSVTWNWNPNDGGTACPTNIQTALNTFSDWHARFIDGSRMITKIAKQM